MQAALESLKRKGDTQATQKQSTVPTQIVRESSPLSSQLSALLFSSSPPQPKQAKVEANDKENKTVDEYMTGGEEDDLDELLKELDEVGDEMFSENFLIKSPEIADICEIDTKSLHSKSHDNAIDTSADAAIDTVIHDYTINSSFVSNVTESTQKHLADTLDYCTEKQTVYSAVDSVYGTVNSEKRLLPMIDISTPQIFSQKPTNMKHNSWEISDIEELSHSQDDTDGQFNSIDNSSRKILLPETFNIDDLRENIKKINKNLHLNPIEAMKMSSERRISFELALMLRDFRQMGSMAQLRLLDGNGQEIVGTLTLSACSELGIKLHFGLILVLTNVSVFSPVPGQKYLNITKQNIQSYHYNVMIVS